MQPLEITDEIRSQIKVMETLASLHPRSQAHIRLGIMVVKDPSRISANDDRQFKHLIIPKLWHVFYSVDETDTAWQRHLSLMTPDPDSQYAAKVLITIGHEFGFKLPEHIDFHPSGLPITRIGANIIATDELTPTPTLHLLQTVKVKSQTS